MTYDIITELCQETRRAFAAIALIRPGLTAGQLCDDPAAAWVADAACGGRTLPVNPATVAALRTAVRELSRYSIAQSGDHCPPSQAGTPPLPSPVVPRRSDPDKEPA